MIPIQGYEGLYSIDENGSIISHKRFGSKGGLVKEYLSKQGYPVVYLSRGHKSKTKKIHRLVAIAFIPNPLNLPQVNHKNGNKLDYSIPNLEWCDAKHNIRHAHATGLTVHPKGHESRTSKLNESQRLEIVRLYAINRLTQTEIATLFNINQTNVSQVVREFLERTLKQKGEAIDSTKL